MLAEQVTALLDHLKKQRFECLAEHEVAAILDPNSKGSESQRVLLHVNGDRQLPGPMQPKESIEQPLSRFERESAQGSTP